MSDSADPTLEGLARAAGISRTAVSYALHRPASSSARVAAAWRRS